jgi:hypothetical protein
MPVRKFRSVEELNQPTWRMPGDPLLYQAMARLWRLGRVTGTQRFPPGVYRARSIEEINDRCRQWSERRVRGRVPAMVRNDL